MAENANLQIGAVVGFDGGRGRGMDALVEVARQAEEVGLASLWFPEHVVFVKDAASRYPYDEGGQPPVGRRPGVYDPLIAIAVAGTVTTRLRLGTGILVLPQREPVTCAQQLVAVDHATQGRFDLGIGVGWLREEFEALGVPWARRGARTDEYVEVLRKLWTDDVVEHAGEFASFAGVQAWPKPVQQPGPPVWVGGNTDPAVERAGRLGDGWFGWKLGPAEVAERLGAVRRAAEAAGRDPAAVGAKVGLPWAGDLEELRPYAEELATLGVGELLVAPAAPGRDVRDRLDELAALAGGR